MQKRTLVLAAAFIFFVAVSFALGYFMEKEPTTCPKENQLTLGTIYEVTAKGTVQAISGNTLTLAAQETTADVSISDSASIIKLVASEKEETGVKEEGAEFTDIKTGDYVIVELMLEA
ncbi:hypothetical protein L6250_02405, partial [Candidatus Parcubacteria bacterium]|nr:hypothetical protein [Candidatus Parcubacteria bacterium]